MDAARQKLASALGYEFENPSLLDVALTHRSAAFEAAPGRKGRARGDNERLEFLGDAVLGFVVSDMLWRRFTEATEGELTRMRAAIVNETSLARVAVAVGLGDALRLGRGEDRSGGRARPSLLADTLEAVFAAVYLDGGLDAARAVIVALLTPTVEAVVSTNAHRDDKTVLQELVQGRHGVTPRYEIVAAEGPDHDRTYHVEMRAGDILTTRGSGRSKKAAEQEAARVALRTLEEGASATTPVTETTE